MKNFFRIYKTCVRTSLSRIVAYRVNFILGILITLLGNLALPLITILIYNANASFPGWSFYEVLLIQSIFILSSGLMGALMNGVLWETMGHIREGNFEVVLLKPLNPLFFLVSTNFEPESIGIVFGGIVLFIIAVINTGIASGFALIQFIIFFIAGCAVMAGISLIMAATSFKWVANSRIPEMFDSVKTFGKYPISIFPKTIQSISTFIIPVGMIGFFPAEALLGRSDSYIMLAVIPCLLFMLFGVWLYQHMIQLYEGVGG